MTAKARTKSLPPKAQHDRFVSTARELGCDETGETFEKAFSVIVPEKRPPRAVASATRSRKDGLQNRTYSPFSRASLNRCHGRQRSS